jgi:hypothetical protein
MIFAYCSICYFYCITKSIKVIALLHRAEEVLYSTNITESNPCEYFKLRSQNCSYDRKLAVSVHHHKKVALSFPLFFPFNQRREF